MQKIVPQPMTFKFNCPSCGNKLYIKEGCHSCDFTYKDWPKYQIHILSEKPDIKQTEKFKEFLSSIV